MRKFLASCAAVLLLAGCNKEILSLPDSTIPYTVKPGEHYFSPSTASFYAPMVMAFKAIFRSSTAYSADELRVPGNQVNKLFGFSDCGKSHTEDSARFGWMMDGAKVDLIPTGADAVSRCIPIYETLPGWKDSTLGAQSFDALPANARSYLARVEALTGVPIAMVSTGPDREETILRHHPFK